MRFTTCTYAVLLALAGPMWVGADLYVDPVNGDDSKDGASAETAFRTIIKARDTIRAKKLNRNMTADLAVYLRGGRYELKDTLRFDARDAASNGHRIIYKAYKGEEPVVCGGRRVAGWGPVAGKPYFKAAVPEQKPIPRKGPKDAYYPPPLHPRFYDVQMLANEGFASYFRQLYVNGVRAELARSHTTRVSSRKGWWDDPETIWFRDGVYISKDVAKNYINPEDIRLLWLQLFKTADMPVAGIEQEGDELLFRMKQPDFYKAPSWQRIQPNKPFFIVNALEELDEPGEWYLDQKKDVVYYYPYQRDGDLNEAEVYAPRVEFLVKIDGSPLEPVHHLSFKGITFQHGNWLAPKDNYLGLSQAEIFQTYTSEFPGQIILDYADDIEIIGCTVRHMGSCGIALYEGCDNVLIEVNVTYDTTGAGITIGKWWSDKRDCLPETVCANIMIRNNVVRNTGRDYWQGTGINIFTAYDCKVHHNDVSDTAYTAVHARIGDSPYNHPRIGKLEYKYNKVSRAFAGHKWGIGDGGHLYMHGVYPDSVITGNYSLHANRNVNYEYYPDNHSLDELWTKNVSRYSKAKNSYLVKGRVTVTGNYSDHKAHPKVQKHTYVKNDQWPEEAQRIMQNAGLESAWKGRLAKIYGHENLAQGKPARASSHLDERMIPKAANDGNWNTLWHTQADGDGKGWWMVDLGAPHVIQRVTILPRQDMYQEHAQKNIEVQGSNDPAFGTYTVLCEQNDVPWYRKHGGSHESNMWEKFIPEMEGFRYLRVKSTLPAGQLNFAEFGAFGYPEAP